MLSRSLLRTVARSSSPRTFSSLSAASSMPRLAPSTTSRASVAPASRSFFGSSKPAAAPATEAQAEAATPDVKAEEAKAAAEAEVKVEDPKLAELEAKVKEHTEKITELTTAIKYSQADYENLKRRSADEFSQASEKSIKRFASDLLSTIDILTLALKHVPQPIPADNAALAALFSGVEMTKVELLKTLSRHGVEPINPVGEKFDPHFHEALYQAPIPGKEPGTVFEVSQVGYTLKGKSLRAAQVGVVRE